MTVTLNVQSIASVLRQVAAVAGLVLSALQSVPLPAGDRPVLAAFGAVILAIEHYVADPSTGTPVAPQSVSSPTP